MLNLLLRLIFKIQGNKALTQNFSTGFKFSKPEPKHFGPRIVSAETARQFPIGFGKGLLLSDIVAEGTVKYKYILAVHDFAGAPSMFVASESNTSALLGGDGSHSLSIFTPDGYENLGSSNDWGNVDRFQAEAVKLVNSRQGLS